jgi:cysteine/O-acetylserine efflux protein
MHNLELLPLLSYVLISTFTPGPSNLSASSLGVLYGLRRTLHYQAGLAAGVVVLMLVGALVSSSLLRWFPAIEPALRYVGAAYILYLAYAIVRSSYTLAEARARPLGFGHGLALQLSNPKVLVYAFTLFSSFLAPIARSAGLVLSAAILLAAISVCATMAWAMFGTAIKTWLRRPGVTRWVNAGLALLLVYAAIELTGLL